MDLENRMPVRNGKGMSAPGSPEAVGPLRARDAKGVGSQFVREGKVVCLSSPHANAHVGDDLCGCLAAHAGKDAPVAFCQNGRDELRFVGGDGASAGALVSRPGVKQASHVMRGPAVRRLTPVECERLQGFPDGWTDVEYRGKPAPDTQRYKALGNSMAVPVIAWIGRRIEGALGWAREGVLE